MLVMPFIAYISPQSKMLRLFSVWSMHEMVLMKSRVTEFYKGSYFLPTQETLTLILPCALLYDAL